MTERPREDAAPQRSWVARIMKWVGVGMLMLLGTMMAAVWFVCQVVAPVDEEGRRQLIEMRKALHAGSSPADVRRLVSSPGYDHLRIHSDLPQNADGTLALATGVQCDAKNWILLLEYKGDSLKSVRVGTLDSWNEYPDDAPPPRAF
jgi:hypothetical protein